jgi:uncharacterized protein with von Willebrand factor type A (vWA) domain
VSEINRELQQHGNFSEAMRKLFPEAPQLTEEQRAKLAEEERLAREARAREILAHVRELGDDY